ncbi:MAG: hypothetical protein KF708_24640 [Pirellulales bacterium]|nr:hypothetical protein [Pirellulales bacterium]
MLSRLLPWSFVCLLGLVSPLVGAEGKTDLIEGMPAGVDASIVKQLDPRHVRIQLDDGDDLCELWVAKTWKTAGEEAPAEDFAPIFYPLQPGSLIGVLKVARPCLDFREQELPAGVYTLRYALQPDLDVHHESHESRDFLLLLPAKEDKSPDPLSDPDKLIELSAAVTLTTHPSIIPLVKPGEVEREEPLRRDEKDPDGWLLLLRGEDAQGTKIPLELIVIKPAE